uniref:Transmembrane and ubiquitin-like domain-containing protein 1 n=1 Tax=Labrus bergylta TaxID=56723 RepID=A0A3Q3G3L6_9LABR
MLVCTSQRCVGRLLFDLVTSRALPWAMALIEGVGDEVTLLFASLLLLLVLLLAWVSTRTSEPPENLFTSATGPAPSLRTSTAHMKHPHLHTTPPLLPLQLFLKRHGENGSVGPQDTIGYIKRKHSNYTEQQVRLIYQGQLLQDDAQTMASLNLVHNCVLHCHISSTPAGAAGGRGLRPGAVALNVGSDIQYRQFFTAPATASLVGVTIFLSLVDSISYRPVEGVFSLLKTLLRFLP